MSIAVADISVMEEAQASLPTYITGEEARGAKSSEAANFSQETTSSWLKRYKWWLQIAMYTFFVLSGGSVGTLLGRLYFDKGGESKWMATLVQIAGFPVLLPFFCTTRTKSQSIETGTKFWRSCTQISGTRKSALVLASVYVSLGLFLSADCMLYSIGLMYLPVTTYTVIAASQLAFNALFSFFLNKQKFTPYIINSVILVTISAILLVFQTDSGSSGKTSRKHYMIGFVCTVAASAGYALMLSLTQLAFQRIIKKENFRQVLNLSFYQSFVASVAILIGLFASGEWKILKKEMDEFKLGEVSYVMDLVWTAVGWQAFTVGAVGLVFKVSSLFSNLISMLSLPIAPVFAVFIFKDKITGLKVVAMLLAMWGFASYIYQHYLDDKKIRAQNKLTRDISQVSMAEAT